MKGSWILLAGAGLLGTAWAGVDAPFADARDESDSRIIAAYEAQCEEWAQNPDVQVEGVNYKDWCMQQMPAIWPVGMDPSED